MLFQVTVCNSESKPIFYKTSSSLQIKMGNSRSQPEAIVRSKLNKPLSNFTEKLMKYGEDKVAAALDSISTSQEMSESTPPVVIKSPPEEIQKAYKNWQLHELGLGRGVNGTDPRPWIHKSSFQVRSADDGNNNLIGTNEGGVLRDFVDEVSSIKSQSAKFDLSITIPNAPVKIGAGADLLRTRTTTKKAFGRRVLTRTIAFQGLFDNQAANSLAKRVLECAAHECSDKPAKNYLDSLPTDKKACIKLFLNFFRRYNITHYVKSITLGACMFIVETESDYKRLVNPSSKLQYEPIASLEVSAVFDKKQNHKSKDIQYIGKLTGEDLSTVEEEAVVDIEVEPISKLFQKKSLNDVVVAALGEYLDLQKQKTVGPYYISCHDSKIFLKVYEGEQGHAQVFGVEGKNQASKFFIYLSDDGDHPYEFYIGWKSEEDDNEGTMRYLNADLSIFGSFNGPLCFESHGKKRESLFAINNPLTLPLYRLRGKDINVNPEVWFEGRESFLIRCTRRLELDGFLAVHMQTGGESQDNRYRTFCKRDAKAHGELGGHMTFRLHHIIKLEEESEMQLNGLHAEIGQENPNAGNEQNENDEHDN